MSAGSAAAIACLTACTSIATGDGPIITAGSIQGTQAIAADAIASGLDQHPPEGWLQRAYARYDPLQISLDRQRIRSYYRDRGYFSARVSDVRVTEHQDGVRVDFFVEEGEPYKISKLSFVQPATVAVDTAAVARTALGPGRLAEGQTFVYADFTQAKRAIAEKLLKSGYAHSTVDGQVVVIEDMRSVEVVIDAKPGPLTRFGTISIIPGPLPEDSIRARLAFKTGDIYDPSLIALTEGRIYELGMVGVVSFYQNTEDRAATIDIRIEVRPGKRNELRIGLGVARQNPNYQMRLRTGYVRRDFFDPLVSVSTEVRPALLYRPSDRTFSFGIEWSGTITREDLFVPRLTGTAEIRYNLLQFEAYSTLGPTGRLVLDRPFINDRLRLSLAANVKHMSFPRVDDVVPRQSFGLIGLQPCDMACIESGTPGDLALAFIEPAVTYDGRDNPIMPQRGGYARLQLEVGHRLSSPGGPWLTMTPEVRGYLSLWPSRIVWAGRARMGAKLLPGTPLPATQRYFGGGSESQRGFTIRQLSPFFGTGDDAVPVGGESLWELSTELRVHLFRLFGMWVGAVAFIDAAEVGTDFADLNFLKPHLATGGGLRLYTPIGPIRFDIGVRLNRVDPGVEPGGSDRIALHLSLGEAF
ncbi:MAG: BamA/TamA family outer membrane protein [Myxococcota bacterium]